MSNDSVFGAFFRGLLGDQLYGTLRIMLLAMIRGKVEEPVTKGSALGEQMVDQALAELKGVLSELESKEAEFEGRWKRAQATIDQLRDNIEEFLRAGERLRCEIETLRRQNNPEDPFQLENLSSDYRLLENKYSIGMRNIAANETVKESALKAWRIVHAEVTKLQLLLMDQQNSIEIAKLKNSAAEVLQRASSVGDGSDAGAHIIETFVDSAETRFMQAEAYHELSADSAEQLLRAGNGDEAWSSFSQAIDARQNGLSLPTSQEPPLPNLQDYRKNKRHKA